MTAYPNLDTRRKRIKFRAWHRGIREMDLILGYYADAHMDTMNAAEMDEFERLMDYDDHDLLSWIIGQSVLPESIDSLIFRHIIAFTHEKKP